MKRGLVVGKFYPPHKAHEHVIATALAETEHVDVLVCDNPAYTIAAKTRAEWLKKLFPDAHIQIIRDIEKDDDSKAWAAYTIKILGYAPDAVYSSEPYGEEYAKRMGSKNRLVDISRTHIPVSARFIRKDVLSYWNYLDPIVRGNFAKRVCVIGAESTGTTTLTRALAKHYSTIWAPEYGRFYTEGKLLNGVSTDWQSDEFTFIAQQQQALEDQLAGQSNGLLFCDTNAYATKVWHQRYLGSTPNSQLDLLAEQAKVDAYIITMPDIPFEQDGMRDGEHIRLDMHAQFVREIKRMKIPYMIAKGNLAYRVHDASVFIDGLLKQKVVI